MCVESRRNVGQDKNPGKKIHAVKINDKIKVEAYDKSEN